MSLVLDLPKYICLGLLKDWFKLVEICLLDTAFCDSSNRIRFVNLITNNVVYWSGPSTKNLDIMNWSIRRQIIVTSFNFNSPICDQYFASRNYWFKLPLHSLKYVNELTIKYSCGRWTTDTVS